MNRPALDVATITTLLCDADGTLFASEEPAFAASAGVTRDLLERYGVPADVTADGLRRASTGSNFRSTAARLLAQHGVSAADEEMEVWVEREKTVVTEHLAAVLLPDAEVATTVKALFDRYALAVVSSSALSRLDACFVATALADWFPVRVRFSAEDSLPEPRSKPDPAVYLHALAALSCDPGQALAIEDAAAGVRSAVAAGVPALGLVQFVPEDERADRRTELLAAGAMGVAESWSELGGWL
jgi:beta-phosphoglucomutase-like phosphatase (HAD superfamily)